MVSSSPEQGRSTGRVIAWAVAATTVLSTVALLLLPLVSQLIAQLTWTSEQKGECLEGSSPCAVTVVPFGPWLSWLSFAWAILILVAIVLCWSPRRWWTPTGHVSPARPGVFSTPEWFRLHAVTAVIVLVGGFGATSGRTSTMFFWDMLWAAGIALLAIVLASVCIRTTAGLIGADTAAGLEKGYSFWLLSAETRLRRAHGVQAPDPAVLIEHHRRSLSTSPRRAARARMSDEGGPE